MAEVAQWGIRVLEIMPGPIETDMLLTSDKPAAAIEHELYAAQAEQLWEGRQSIRAMYTPPAEAAAPHRRRDPRRRRARCASAATT